jgi:hypothetical protein
MAILGNEDGKLKQAGVTLVLRQDTNLYIILCLDSIPVEGNWSVALASSFCPWTLA